MRLQDKVAIVTGAGSGIGRGISIMFAKEGAKVVVCDYNEDTAKQTVFEIEQFKGEAIALKCDVSKQKDIEKVVKKTIDSFSRIDILVNNAGVYLPHKATEVNEKEWQKTIDVDLKGVWLFSKACLPHMEKQGKGKIINIASIAGFVAFANSTAYCAAKGGVILLTKEMALDYAPKKININAIAPGVITTNMTKQILSDKQAYDGLLRNTPIGRFGVPDDIAYCAVYLAAFESDFVTGQTFVVDGGWTIQ